MVEALDQSKTGLTKQELIDWLNNRKDIPDDATLELDFDEDSKIFSLFFNWSEPHVPAVFGDEFVHFAKTTSNVLLDVIEKSK